MAYTYDDNSDLLINGWETGIASSPHTGTAIMQSVNISTENKEVMCSYARVQQSQVISVATGNITPNSSTALNVTFAVTLQAGMWIHIDSSTITNLSAGISYFVNSVIGGVMQLQTDYQSAILGSLGLTGAATFTLLRNMGNPISSATEKYSDGSTFQYRYYVLDANGLIWVNDSGVTWSGGNGWFLPDNGAHSGSTGIAVLNGFLFDFVGNIIYCKPTSILQNSTPGWRSFSSGFMTSPTSGPNPHFPFAGHQGLLYYTDGNVIGSIFPSSGTPNIQSYATYTASSTTGTLSVLINGSVPSSGLPSPVTPVPAAFFTHGTQPNNLTVGTLYYIKWLFSGSDFEVYPTAADAIAGSNKIDIAAGAVGTQYFNTFDPNYTGGESTIVFTPQALFLPFFETATCIGEIGNLILVGTKSNTVYPWNQVDPTPQDLIVLPENNVTSILTVNNTGYIFAGVKGNIYVTNGSAASLAISVPDYCAGIDGTPGSYVEPYFTWGGSMYLRGRVYFSILDQTSTKAGNCGGIWSFIPTQNMYVGQDVGLSLRLENQSSYGTYNGVSMVLLASQSQSAKSPQYWNGWESSTSGATYGIDFTDTKPNAPAIIETDLIPTGTYLDKQTFQNVEYKLAAPLASGETVAISYRTNATDAFVSCGTVIVESATGLSGYYQVNFEKTQWLQFRITMTPLNSSSSSFCRLVEIRLR